MLATFSDDGGRLEMIPGEVLEVRLPESQVSGYMWQYDEKSCPCLRLFESIYIEKGPARFTGQGERSWFFTAIGPGECTLTFLLMRPWSVPKPEYRIIIRIK